MGGNAGGYRPGYAPGFNQGYHPGHGGAAGAAGSSRTYRQAGFKHGSSDRAHGLSNEPSRYFATVPGQFHRAFANGYSEGYGTVAEAQGNQYYQGGSVTGATDFQKGLSYEPSRYAATVPTQFRRDFSQGYANGWRAAGGR